MIYTDEIERIKNQIVEKFAPIDIYLFGSHAKGLITKSSDIDLCIIINTDDKREMVRKILLEIDYDIDLDVVVYTEEEWRRYKDDASTFANIIYRTGVSLLDRHN